MSKSFFNADKILNAVKRAEAKALQKGGAYVMTVAKNSIKTASGANDHASPGAPPKDHFGAQARIDARKLKKQGVKPPTRRGVALGIRNIQFDLDSSGQQLIVGMVGSRSNYSNGMSLPELFEKGGDVTNTKQKKGRFAGKRLHYHPHPVMGPALKTSIERGKLAEPFKDSVK